LVKEDRVTRSGSLLPLQAVPHNLNSPLADQWFLRVEYPPAFPVAVEVICHVYRQSLRL